MICLDRDGFRDSRSKPIEVPMLELLLGTAKYRCFVLLPEAGGDELWCHGRWGSIVRPGLDGILQELGFPCSVYCRQIEGEFSKEVRFGQLSWSEESDAKWNIAPGGIENRIFVDFQIYSPPRPQLEKTRKLPCFYCQVKPMVFEGVPSSTAYEAAVFLAFKQSEVNASDFEEAIRDLAGKLRARIYTARLRIGGVNAFESVMREQFMYLGMLNDAWPNLKRPKGSWQVLDR